MYRWNPLLALIAALGLLAGAPAVYAQEEDDSQTSSVGSVEDQSLEDLMASPSTEDSGFNIFGDNKGNDLLTNLSGDPLGGGRANPNEPAGPGNYNAAETAMMNRMIEAMVANAAERGAAMSPERIEALKKNGLAMGDGWAATAGMSNFNEWGPDEDIEFVFDNDGNVLGITNNTRMLSSPNPFTGEVGQTDKSDTGGEVYGPPCPPSICGTVDKNGELDAPPPPDDKEQTPPTPDPKPDDVTAKAVTGDGPADQGVINAMRDALSKNEPPTSTWDRNSGQPHPSETGFGNGFGDGFGAMAAGDGNGGDPGREVAMFNNDMTDDQIADRMNQLRTQYKAAQDANFDYTPIDPDHTIAGRAASFLNWKSVREATAGRDHQDRALVAIEAGREDEGKHFYSNVDMRDRRDPNKTLRQEKNTCSRVGTLNAVIRGNCR
jgi:hypothetical protein